MGCAMRGHSYCVGNACFHRADHPLDIYHSILLRNNPSYDKVIVTPQWQDYPIIDLYGTEVNLNDVDLVDSVTNNLNCICVGDKEFRLSMCTNILGGYTTNAKMQIRPISIGRDPIDGELLVNRLEGRRVGAY